MNNYWVFTFNKNIHKYHILISGNYPYSEMYGDISGWLPHQESVRCYSNEKQNGHKLQ